MKTTQDRQDGTKRRNISGALRDWARRRGNIVVLSAGVMVMVMGFSAFTVDVGFIALTRTQMQAASDGAVLAAAQELAAAFQPGISGGGETNVTGPAELAAVEIAALHRAADRDSITVVPDQDVRFGQYRYFATSNSWEKTWGVAPYNLVEVTLRRAQAGDPDAEPGSSGDGPIPLFFAPVIGVNDAEVTTTSAAAMLPGVGFRIIPGSGMNALVLPFAFDEHSWNRLMDENYSHEFNDDFSYNPETRQVVPGTGDGILEINLYPYGNHDLPPGNRGTVDIGSPNNSTNDLKRQILYGLNEYDLSFFGGQLRLEEDVPLQLNGDTGISAGMKEQLETIKGQTRAIPIFSEVSGPGNNAMFTIVKFVGIRILDVRLTGGNKHLIVQPAPFSDPTVIPGEGPIEVDTILSTPKLIR
ncbi:MAG: Tad domain-containing protein [Planctomycetaceae bacterium]